MMVVLVLLAALASQPEQVVSRLFAATNDGPYVSYSWGEHWVGIRPELRGFEGDIATFVCLGPAVYAGGSGGVFVSDDYGENYVRVASFPAKDVIRFEAARLFALEPTIFAGTTSGLYRSSDGGREWMRVGALEMTTAVRDIA